MERRGELAGKLWLALLKEGGRWKSGDLADKVREGKVEVSQKLSSMADSGHVRQFPVEGRTRSFVYGVTPACSVPQGVVVQDVADCVMRQAVEP